MKKRLLSLLLASIMVLSLVACGNTDVEGEVASTETRVKVENYVPTYPIVEEKITVTGLVVGADTTVSATERQVWNEVEAITNIHVEWENIDNDAFSTRLASGQWPDIIVKNMGQTGMYDYGVLGGRLVNFLDYIDIMPNLKKTFEDYPHTLAYSTQLNGAVYNFFRVSGPHPTSVGCRPHYLKHVLAKAGVEKAPTTIDEFYDALVKCKEFYGEPAYMHFKNESSHTQSIFGAFGDLTQMDFSDLGDGKLIFARTSEQMKLYLEFMHKLYDEELMHREYLTLDNAAMLKLTQGGTIAFPAQGSVSSLTLDDLDGDWDNIGTLTPLTSEYDPEAELCAYADYNNTSGYHVNADSPYVEEICKMLDIMWATEEVVPGSNLYGTNFATGPEHITWTDNGDGTYTQHIPDGFKSKDTWVSQVYHWGTCGRNDAIAGLVTDNPCNKKAREVGYMENIMPYMNDILVNIDQMKFTEDEQYVIDNKWGEIKSYYQQMEAEFISGATDIATGWDAYVERLDQMGVAEVQAVFQAAYDRYLNDMEALSK